MDKLKLVALQLSDLHIRPFENILEPMIDNINHEKVDVVVITGDITHDDSEESFNIAKESISKINHRVIVMPGDFGKYSVDDFGSRFKNLSINGYTLDFLDTSYIGHRHAEGWYSSLKNDTEQYDWLMKSLSGQDYHIVFSHHPFEVFPSGVANEFLTDKVRAFYSGHLHTPLRYQYNYSNPSKFKSCFSTVPMDFHGTIGYAIIVVNSADEVFTIPRIVKNKIKVW
jgi:3',5'-cyclic AMP phosphodiesterase CpdA